MASISFGIISREQSREAYQWHRGFAGNYEFIFPRAWEDYERLVADRQVWCAWDETGDFVASAYFAFDEQIRSWEIGGIMVIAGERKTGVAGVLGRLIVGHVLVAENPLKRNDRVIAHVHAENAAPLPLLTGALKFEMPLQPQEFPGDKLPGLRKNDRGNVDGFELSMKVPDSIEAIAVWCENFKGTLRDGREAKLLLPADEELANWAVALRRMIPAPKPTLRRIR